MTEYDAVTLWLLILVAGVGTFAIKLSFVQLFGWLDEVSPVVAGVLRFVPAAVLAALVVDSVVTLSASPSLHLAFDPAELLAASVAAVVAWRTESVPLTLAVGMVVLWSVTALA
ncbi:branched-chain amino acid ABC transporter permease [Halobacteriales archaeon QS_1_68_20]|nr:MAG: branched-chain amino acid ABC transporter permease [Halobacteriales archaeon QS_1_68_20]